ncbi:hypothetical protein BJ138DRAFT_1150577 [Hygrophoropsis aurantiaca]|uniref:Uncharacterized protein n=1 Tax=Hygrophoropsis aurantiaca TaxID=72124 RepID=A0ACB8ADV9_9AGAM|nr:hypothetical protein BJ138DRAFT_1150577 [Hygrophoropsis aurantiaca]
MSTSSSLLALKSVSSRSSATSSSTGTSLGSDYDSDYPTLSSGMTSPADEDIHSLNQVSKGDQKTRRSSIGGFRMKPSETAQTPPSRTLSVAMRKVRRALTMFRRKRMDGIQIALPAKVSSAFSTAAESFYSLPNGQLSEQDLRAHPIQEAGVRRFGTVTGSTIVDSAFRRPRAQRLRLSNFSTLSRSVDLSAVLTTQTPEIKKTDRPDALKVHPDFQSLLGHILRFLFFLPWCAAVGAALLLFPAQLDAITFAPGYIAHSPRGIKRFSHWADCAIHHVVIFLAFAAVLIYYDKTVGVPLGGALVSRFVYVWNDFRIDRSIPLGEDNRQTLFLLATDRAFAGEEFVVRDASGVIVHATELSMD